ncbi:MAG: anaerobic ribonucleoside-triphosphate reductase activating protein [Ruminococcus sp.]|nr:anaerobic ribonucleoside-triphosphate reductase activating protein [Ruminococcus sp.]
MTLRIAGTENDSIVDGPGFRFTIFTQGCPHHCPGCHNPQTHDFSGGEDVALEDLLSKIDANPMLDGVTFSGGEPFCQAKPLAKLGAQIRKRGLNVITYTGFTYEQLLEHATDENGYAALLAVTDFLVDGRFEEDKQSYLLRFRGSSNQRFLDLEKTRESGIPTEVIFPARE